MPSHPFFTNWTAGEVTEKLDARTDFAKYHNAARVVKNGVVLPQGGVASRAGTIFLGLAKYTDKRVKLQTFQFSVDQSYIVEFGDLYARFWTDRGPVLDGSNNPVEVVTPYVEADLRELRFEQSADVMYIGHPDHPPAKLSRITLTSFEYTEMGFFPPPTYEAREAPDAILTLSTITPGTGTATADAAVFLNGDVGRQIWSGAGRAVITGFTSTTQVAIRVLDPFSASVIASGSWQMDGSPNNAKLTFSAQVPVWVDLAITADAAAFRPTDVGKFLYAYEGIIMITGYVSSTSMVGQLLKVITTAITPSTELDEGLWTLESRMWTASNGYPGVPCLFQQRLWWAGSPAFKDYVWASVIADYENHGRGALDNDAIVFQLATPGVNLIRWMKPHANRGIALGSIASEITIDGGNDAAITPTNGVVSERTHYGSSYTPDAVKFDSQSIFIQRGGRRVRELAYRFSEDNFKSPDISILAEHLFREEIVELTYCSTPESLLFGVRDDGLINLCTYERDQEVVAWSHLETNEEDDFESVAWLPNACGTGDEIWTAVRRDIGGDDYWASTYWAENYWGSDYWGNGGNAQLRTIEVFDGAMNTDSGLTYEGVGVSTFTGLTHLEGRAVRVVIDDGTEYDLTVAGGLITLPTGVTTTSAEVGLPWVMTLVTVRPDLAIPNGTIQGRRKRWNRVTVRVYCTTGNPLLNGEAMQYPEEQDPPTTGRPFSGDMREKTDFSWDREGFITVQRTEAKACTVTGITGALSVADD